MANTDKELVANVSAFESVQKNTGKIVSQSVSALLNLFKNTVTLTMNYAGTAELGLGAQEGAYFNILVTGTFTVFSITMNGKTLTYTENCVAQTITIDNVNATVKNGTTNKMDKVTGDTTDFLKLIPGNNVVNISKTGDEVAFRFDFRPQYI